MIPCLKEVGGTGRQSTITCRAIESQAVRADVMFSSYIVRPVPCRAFSGIPEYLRHPRNPYNRTDPLLLNALIGLGRSGYHVAYNKSMELVNKTKSSAHTFVLFRLVTLQ